MIMSQFYRGCFRQLTAACFIRIPAFKGVVFLLHDRKTAISFSKGDRSCRKITFHDISAIWIQRDLINIWRPDCLVSQIFCRHNSYRLRIPCIGVAFFYRLWNPDLCAIVNRTFRVILSHASVKIPCQLILISRIVIIDHIGSTVCLDRHLFTFSRLCKACVFLQRPFNICIYFRSSIYSIL